MRLSDYFDILPEIYDNIFDDIIYFLKPDKEKTIYEVLDYVKNKYEGNELKLGIYIVGYIKGLCDK